jgi:hypothetical protein
MSNTIALKRARGAKSPLNGWPAHEEKNAAGLPNAIAQPVCPAMLLLGRLTRAWSSFDPQTLSAFLVKRRSLLRCQIRYST